ncbi:MAG: calmodulin-binding protein [Pirellulaceae bacterium]
MAFVAFAFCCVADQADAQQQAYGRVWGGTNSSKDWNRFYHYPYVYYPQNFYAPQYFQSADDMYYRYPQEMRIPVYNKKWHNYYPAGQRYHYGHHFILDVF